MFVKTNHHHITIDGRTYAAGSVVECDNFRGKALVNGEHAIEHIGPAAETEFPDDPETQGDASPRSRRLERATR